MKMLVVTKILVLTILFSWVKNTICSDSSYDVRDACSVTRYQNLCIHSLSSYSSHSAKKKSPPSIWARAGVSVTIGEAKNVTKFLKHLKKHKAMKGQKNRGALLDCIECFGDSLDNLHRSLGVLRKLDASEFDVQMGDVTTWLSAALTDEDTCLDGFEFDENTTISKQVRMVRYKVSKVTYITSNALALVNKLASTGIGNSIH